METQRSARDIYRELCSRFGTFMKGVSRNGSSTGLALLPAHFEQVDGVWTSAVTRACVDDAAREASAAVDLELAMLDAMARYDRAIHQPAWERSTEECAARLVEVHRRWSTSAHADLDAGSCIYTPAQHAVIAEFYKANKHALQVCRMCGCSGDQLNSTPCYTGKFGFALKTVNDRLRFGCKRCVDLMKRAAKHVEIIDTDEGVHTAATLLAACARSRHSRSKQPVLTVSRRVWRDAYWRVAHEVLKEHSFSQPFGADRQCVVELFSYNVAAGIHTEDGMPAETNKRSMQREAPPRKNYKFSKT